jgi:uncharacterized repeat protein (TIGR04138 family)
MAQKQPGGETHASDAAPARDLEADIRERVLSRDSRYDFNAYAFLYEALEFTQKRLGRDAASLDPKDRHVTGQELLEGIRQYATDQFGPLAAAVFRAWGVTRTGDFGRIVFNLVNAGLLGKTESDRIEDFDDGYDFDEAFGPSLDQET